MMESEGVTQEVPSIMIQPIHQLLHCNYNNQTPVNFEDCIAMPESMIFLSALNCILRWLQQN